MSDMTPDDMYRNFMLNGVLKLVVTFKFLQLVLASEHSMQMPPLFGINIEFKFCPLQNAQVSQTSPLSFVNEAVKSISFLHPSPTTSWMEEAEVDTYDRRD